MINTKIVVSWNFHLNIVTQTKLVSFCFYVLQPKCDSSKIYMSHFFLYVLNLFFTFSQCLHDEHQTDISPVRSLKDWKAFDMFDKHCLFNLWQKRKLHYPTSSEVFFINGPPFTLVFVIFSASCYYHCYLSYYFQLLLSSFSDLSFLKVTGTKHWKTHHGKGTELLDNLLTAQIHYSILCLKRWLNLPNLILTILPQRMIDCTHFFLFYPKG